VTHDVRPAGGADPEPGVGGGPSILDQPSGPASGVIADLRARIRSRREEYLQLRAEFEEIQREERKEREAREERESNHPVSLEEFKTQTDRINGVLDRPAPSFGRPVPRSSHEPHGLDAEDLGIELRVPSIFEDGYERRRDRENPADARQ